MTCEQTHHNNSPDMFLCESLTGRSLCMGQGLTQGAGAPLELYRLPHVAPRSFSAKSMRYCNKPSSQQKLILIHCIPTTNTLALLMYHY